MHRIGIDGMKVEHFHARHTHPETALAYTNMLGACRGNEGSPKAHQHHVRRRPPSSRFVVLPAGAAPTAWDLRQLETAPAEALARALATDPSLPLAAAMMAAVAEELDAVVTANQPT